MVNGTGPYRFILDTGATETVLTPATAAKAGVEGYAVTPRQQRGVVRELRVGDAALRDLPVHIFDPPQALPLRLDRGADYGGILGATFLRRFVTTLDYARRRVRLETAGSARERPAEGIRVPFAAEQGVIRVTGTINGKGPVRLLLDTGSAEVLVRPEAAHRLRLAVSGAGGPNQAGFARLRALAVGPAVVSNVTAVVAVPPGDDGTLSAYDGIVGYPWLSRFVLTVSYGERYLLLRPARGAAPATPAGDPPPPPW
jgi:predicted aspartyl protease